MATTVVPAAQDVAVEEPIEEFELGYVAAHDVLRRVSLMDASMVRFEAMVPVRRFNIRQGQRHLPGRWWSATDAGHVGYESWLERDHLMWLDFDPAVAAIASQPFWLFWTTLEGRSRSHTPDSRIRRRTALKITIGPTRSRAAINRL